MIMNSFMRGLDPRRAMGTGTFTWDNIESGNILQAKKFIEIGKTSNDERVFARDRRPAVWGLGIPAKYFVNVVSIVRNYRTRKGKTTLINLTITFISSSTIEGTTVNRWLHRETLRGSFEQFQNHFEIVQDTKL